MPDSSRGVEWRKISNNEWWLVFSDAPKDFGRDGPIGFPPMMSITWTGNDYSCVHLNAYSNGRWPDEAETTDDDYLHICDPRELIKDLTLWMMTAEYKKAADA